MPERYAQIGDIGSRDNYFYHGTIKNSCTIFGALFSNIYIRNSDGDFVPISIVYGGQPKYKVANENNEERGSYNLVLPQISFSLTGISYDAARKLNHRDNLKYRVASGDGEETIRLATPSPWILNFSMAVRTKYLEHGFQIIEQIVPNFTPTLHLDLKDIPEITDSKYTRISLTLDSVLPPVDQYEGIFTEERTIEFQLEFSMKVNLFGPASQTQLISRDYINTFLDKGQVFVTGGIPIVDGTDEFEVVADPQGQKATTRGIAETEEIDKKDY